MYNGQYAKGVVHLVVFAILVSLTNENGIFGLFVAGWVCYQAMRPITPLAPAATALRYPTLSV